jgi:hypothetical protein
VQTIRIHNEIRLCTFFLSNRKAIKRIADITKYNDQN